MPLECTRNRKARSCSCLLSEVSLRLEVVASYIALLGAWQNDEVPRTANSPGLVASPRHQKAPHRNALLDEQATLDFNFRTCWVEVYPRIDSYRNHDSNL
jgi:hypothetical protein